MALPKVLLYKHKIYKDGTNPIVIQVIKERKIFRVTVAAVKESQWDQENKLVKKHPLKDQINNDIRDRLIEISNKIYEAEKTGQDVDYQQIISKKTPSEAKNKINFTGFLYEIITEMQDNLQVATAQRYQTTQNLIGIFTNEKPVAFTDIDHKWITRFNTYLIGRGNVQNTRSKRMAYLRTIFNRAIKQKLVKENPFEEVEIKYKKTTKVKLNRLEFDLLCNQPLKAGSSLEASRDFFVLAFYLRGVRVSDLLQAGSEDFVQNRLIYIADKTDTAYNIKLVPEASAIVNRYKGKHYKLFPFFNWHPNLSLSKYQNEKDRIKHCESKTTIINTNLKKLAKLAGIEKNISTHIARHTFAKMAIDAIGNPRITMGMLGHTSLAVHQGYIRDLEQSDELDAAADKIFGGQANSL